VTSAVPTFEQIYADCSKKVQALCVHLLGNTADAQDAFQETFLAVAVALPGFRGESSASTWVHRIAIRVALKMRTKQRAAPASHETSEPSADPRAQIAREDRVAHAMARLSFEHRVVLALFGVAGMTHAEIAEALDVPEGTVWSRLHHAKKQLGALLAG
jgi:RNA polymerase sigma-70 factor (ECF subfamily)